jgi:hypothetical protein
MTEFYPNHHHDLAGSGRFGRYGVTVCGTNDQRQ